jgi:hypothetical protein
MVHRFALMKDSQNIFPSKCADNLLEKKSLPIPLSWTLIEELFPMDQDAA